MNFTNRAPPSISRYLIRKKKKLSAWRIFSNVVRGSFHACYLGYSIAQKWQGQGLMFEALTAAIRYMQRTQHIHRIMAKLYAAQQT
ncbi:ribosomal-protein-alanine acetyltransferase [Salmonella enterica subsp. enterica]|uniref:Ribosomal-protein-alanine acetyltransferase n=1 Tax=Salmonella enterica I TaxID=59201 RepID=A0A3S4IV46_SALET|nr:ribosomal-protein-alanine acetyltransferase [Salmonella enterica subsp. enterica]